MIGTWTVIGVYDNGQTFADKVEAGCPYEAMQAVARAAKKESTEYDLQIIGAILTAADLIPACDESGNAAYAVDLATMTEEDVLAVKDAIAGAIWLLLLPVLGCWLFGFCGKNT